MEKSAVLNKSPMTDAEYAVVVDLYLKKIELLHDQMQSDQHEIETARVETRDALANIKQTIKALRSVA